MNLSKLSRQEQVLQELALMREVNEGWIVTEDLRNKIVGGSNGLVRLRELRSYGWWIERMNCRQYNERYATYLNTDSHFYRLATSWFAEQALWVLATENPRRRHLYLTRSNDFSILREFMDDEKSIAEFKNAISKAKKQKGDTIYDQRFRRLVLKNTDLCPILCSAYVDSGTGCTVRRRQGVREIT